VKIAALGAVAKRLWAARGFARSFVCYGENVSEAKPLKIGFIGTGFIGQHQIKLLKKVPGAQVIAAADIKESARKTASELGVAQTFDSHQKMLKALPEIEAVSVCTPNGCHLEHTVAALDAGKDVMVEKPMAMSAQQGQKMLDAAKRNKKKLIVGFQHRFEPKSKMIRDQIVAGDFGKILYVRAQALRRRGIPSWGVFGQKKLQGGGPMIDIGVHILETAHYLIGSPKPISATGSTFTYLGDKPMEALASWGAWDYKTYTVEDLAVGMIRFDSGTALTIESSFAAHIEKDIWNITILGEKGGANWESSQIFTDHGGYMMNCTAAHVGTWDHFEYKMQHFVEVCRDGRKNEVPGEHGLMVQKMLDGVYASAAQGREVTIK
jgi:predicted dehydrogenase